MSLDYKEKRVNLSSLPGLPEKFKEEPNRFFQQTAFSSSTATKWSEELSHWVRSFLMKLRYPFRKVSAIPFEEPLKTSIRRFLVSLDAYVESKNPVIPIDYLLQNAGDITFATKLKRIRFKSFLESTKAKCMDFNDWWKDCPSYPIQDIGDIFNYQYLPHFEEECEDYLEGFTPLVQSQKWLDRFKKTCVDLFDFTTISRIIRPEEVLLGTSGSSSLTSKLLSKKSYLLNGTKENFFSERRSLCKRSVIQVCPGGPRDAVINQLADLNTIKLIEYQIQVFLEENFSKYLVNKDSEDFAKKYSKFQKKYIHFICRDIKKEGITKPRNLLKIMLEALHEKYPEVKAFEYFSFYETYEFFHEGKTYKPVRGHGLGMANALTSLMQIVLFEMTLFKAAKNQVSDDSSFITLNDDIILGFPDKTSLEAFWDAEETVFEGLGLLRSAKKSFYGRHCGVFIEKYFCDKLPNLSRKESYSNREMLIALTATNIVQAKQIVSSQSYIDPESISKYFEEIVSFWGYEFFPNEYEYPSSCGGWLSHSIYGISLDLKILEDLPFDGKVERAYQACLTNRIEPRGGKDKYVPSAVSLYFPEYLSKIDEKYYKNFCIGTERDLHREFSRLRYNPSLYTKAWNVLLKKRREIYITHVPRLLFKEFISVLSQNSDKDYYPLDFMIEKTVMSEGWKGKVIDFYQSTNPLLGYLSSIYPIEGVYPNKYSIEFQESDRVDFKLTADQRKRLTRYVGILPLTNKMSRKEFNIPKSEEDYLQMMESFINPMRLSKVYGDLSSYMLPILKEEYRPRIIQSKKEVFGRFLSKDELIFFSSTRKRISEGKIRLIMSFNLTLKDFYQEVIPPVKPEVPQEEFKISSEPVIDQITEENFEKFCLGEPTSRACRMIFEDLEQCQFETRFYYSNQLHQPTADEEDLFKSNMKRKFPLGWILYEKWFLHVNEEAIISSNDDTPDWGDGGFDDF